jgi:hypothetical protein
VCFSLCLNCLFFFFKAPGVSLLMLCDDSDICLNLLSEIGLKSFLILGKVCHHLHTAVSKTLCSNKAQSIISLELSNWPALKRCVLGMLFCLSACIHWLYVSCTVKLTDRQKEKDRQTNRQTDRQTDRWTNKQTGRQTRQTDS